MNGTYELRVPTGHAYVGWHVIVQEVGGVRQLRVTGVLGESGRVWLEVSPVELTPCGGDRFTAEPGPDPLIRGGVTDVRGWEVMAGAVAELRDLLRAGPVILVPTTHWGGRSVRGGRVRRRGA